jgi:hypothetical protein
LYLRLSYEKIIICLENNIKISFCGVRKPRLSLIKSGIRGRFLSRLFSFFMAPLGALAPQHQSQGKKVVARFIGLIKMPDKSGNYNFFCQNIELPRVIDNIDMPPGT